MDALRAIAPALASSAVRHSDSYSDVVIGIGILLRGRNYRALLLFLMIPAYYSLSHAPIHAERRYVIGIQYFTLILPSVAIFQIGSSLIRLLRTGRLTGM